MEKLFITPKRKSSYRSDSEPSPGDKRLKESNSPAKISSGEDGVMEVLRPKIDLCFRSFPMWKQKWKS